jgi:putative endonuclease
MQYGGSVYIMTNATHTVLYIGVTANLYTRVDDHKNKRNPESFTAKYNCCKLVYYENYSKIEEAIAYEKSLKNWHREWKINLINKLNPTWKDLVDEI